MVKAPALQSLVVSVEDDEHCFLMASQVTAFLTDPSCRPLPRVVELTWERGFRLDGHEEYLLFRVFPNVMGLHY